MRGKVVTRKSKIIKSNAGIFIVIDRYTERRKKYTNTSALVKIPILRIFHTRVVFLSKTDRCIFESKRSNSQIIKDISWEMESA